jgi:hypothetical protein
VEISTEKTEIMAFQGIYPIYSKVILYNKIIEQVSCLKFLGYYVTYENEKDIAEKITNLTEHWE